MKYIKRSLVLVLVFASLLLSACGTGASPVTGGNEKPVQLEEIEGSKLKRVILTEKAAQRIDVQTVKVTSRLDNGVSRDVVPYAAVIYDIEGNTWVYTNPAPLTYVREQIVVEHIDGDTAFLSQKMRSKSPVVIVGVAEIYGAETGVSK